MTGLIQRIGNIVKAKVNETKGSAVVSKHDLYNIFNNKINNLYLNEQSLINQNDYPIIVDYIQKDKIVHDALMPFFQLYRIVEAKNLKLKFSKLHSIYHQQYNFLIMFDVIKARHLVLPENITQVENELNFTISHTRQIMFYLFGSIRQILTASTQVFCTEKYCTPHNNYRQLDSLLKANWEITDEHMLFIKNISQTAESHFKNLAELLDLIESQVNLLISYYEAYGDNYKSSVLQDNKLGNLTNPYASQMGNYMDASYRSEELKVLQNIMNNKNY